MKRCLNTKLNGSKETVDQLCLNDFESVKAFRLECKRLISEYYLAGGVGNLYWSQRCCNNWKGA